MTTVSRRAFVHASGIAGAMTLNELSDHVPELVLESGEVTTVGGYVTQQIGRIPEMGETVEILGYEAEVTEANERRVGQLRFRRLAPVADGDGPPFAGAGG